MSSAAATVNMPHYRDNVESLIEMKRAIDVCLGKITPLIDKM